MIHRDDNYKNKTIHVLSVIIANLQLNRVKRYD